MRPIYNCHRFITLKKNSVHAQRDKQVCSGQIKRRGKECEARGIPIHSSLCDMPPMGFWGLGKSNKGGVGTARKKKPFALCSYIARKKWRKWRRGCTCQNRCVESNVRRAVILIWCGRKTWKFGSWCHTLCAAFRLVMHTHNILKVSCVTSHCLWLGKC